MLQVFEIKDNDTFHKFMNSESICSAMQKYKMTQNGKYIRDNWFWKSTLGIWKAWFVPKQVLLFRRIDSYFFLPSIFPLVLNVLPWEFSICVKYTKERDTSSGKRTKQKISHSELKFHFTYIQIYHWMYELYEYGIFSLNVTFCK